MWKKLEIKQRRTKSIFIFVTKIFNAQVISVVEFYIGILVTGFVDTILSQKLDKLAALLHFYM